MKTYNDRLLTMHWRAVLALAQDWARVASRFGDADWEAEMRAEARVAAMCLTRLRKKGG